MTNTQSLPIMAHMVIGYPSLEESRKTAELYIENGMEILELQIPFSHPTADGSVLTSANKKAVETGTTLEKSLQFLADLRRDYPNQKIMVMTYLNKLFAFGLDNFCNRLKAVEIPYIIIPDLPFDSALASEIHQHDYAQICPVISANTSDARLDIALSTQPDYIYLMADYKITGSGFSIHPKIQKVVDTVKEKSPNTKLGLGFGISNKAQVSEVLKIADFAIIGSAFTKALDEGKLNETLEGFA
ncbi:MAG: tryptophan synthase alpha chain [Arenicella sp.]|jgi:tryptophan synthase alpha chain